MLSVSLVSRVTARSLHDNMRGCQSSSGEWSVGLQLIMARYTRIVNCRPCCNLLLKLATVDTSTSTSHRLTVK